MEVSTNTYTGHMQHLSEHKTGVLEVTYRCLHFLTRLHWSLAAALERIAVKLSVIDFIKLGHNWIVFQLHTTLTTLCKAWATNTEISFSAWSCIANQRRNGAASHNKITNLYVLSSLRAWKWCILKFTYNTTLQWTTNQYWITQYCWSFSLLLPCLLFYKVP